jgi:peptidoglycan/LPS O-acetylase OafA/YrhL
MTTIEGADARLGATVFSPAAVIRPTARPEPRKGERIPSLDGLRAVAIGLVALSHLAGERSFPIPFAPVDKIDAGPLGVRVFFVLSGYLITGLLLRELKDTGTLRLGRFYLRRTFRIFPAYYVFIAVIVAAAQVGLVTLWPGDIAAGLTYTMNFHRHHSWVLGHAWSLAVEEQFYLVWPAALLLLGRRRALWVAGALLLVLPVARLIAYERGLIGPDNPRSWLTYADALATGCLLAGLGGRLWRWQLYRSAVLSRTFPVVPLMIPVISTGFDRPRFSALAGLTLLNLAIAVTIDGCVRRPVGWGVRLLNWRPIATIGVLSYSLYLWQEPFLDRSTVAWYTTFPLNVGPAALAAFASYRLVERPFLSLRRRFEPAALPPRTAAAPAK